MKRSKISAAEPHRTIKKWQVVTGLVFVLLVAGFLCRGYIRRNGTMLYGKVFVLPKLSERASVEFQPINAKLSDLMINMHPPQKMCSDYPYYSRLSISTSCSVDASSINVGLTEALKNNWQQKASLLDKELTSHGWESTDYEGHLKLQDLLTKDSYWVATYVKKTSQYECYIAIRFDVHDSQSEPLRVDESCYRFIHVFGGY